MYLHKLKIGNVELENNILLAPMAGITDLPFRLISEEFGPGLVTTEMVSSKAIQYNDEKTKGLMKTEGEKGPIAIQIFGSDPEAMAFATKYIDRLVCNAYNKDIEYSKDSALKKSRIEDMADRTTEGKIRADINDINMGCPAPKIIDINMGCPAPKVVKNGDGSKLLTDLDKAGEVIKSVVDQANLSENKLPVTLKMRTGWDTEHIVAVQVAKLAESLGISSITVHGRTRSEYYSGKADLQIIKKVKESVSIPVIGNGDVADEESAKEMFERTGVDGIMIGRASIGNPWIFEKVKYYLEYGEKLPDRSLEEKLKIIKKHFQLVLQEKGEYTGVREFRKYIAYYTKGLPNSSEFRTRINTLESSKEVIRELEMFFNGARDFLK